MAKETKNSTPQAYGEVVERLEAVVKRLEGGELALEDSLKEFEEGIRLVRHGERLLGEAEKRVEELLQEGGDTKVVPVEGASGMRLQPRPSAAAAPTNEDDIPF